MIIGGEDEIASWGRSAEPCHLIGIESRERRSNVGRRVERGVGCRIRKVAIAPDLEEASDFFAHI